MNNQFRNIILWEDEKVRRLGGVALLRPVWAIRSGCGILRESALSHFSGKLHRWVRPHLVEWQRLYHPGSVVNEAITDIALFINGRLWDATLLEKLPVDKEWIAVMSESGDQTVVAASLKHDAQEKLLAMLTNEGWITDDWMELGIPVISVENELELVQTPFDVLVRQETEIALDIARRLSNSTTHPLIQRDLPGVWLENPDQIFIHPSVKIGKQIVIDASDGPIWIDEGTIIEGHAFLKGPLAIGSNCTLRAGIKLYGPSSIGPVCKLGGEIQKTLWMGYSNKQHDGYLGTGVIGSWVNIGAGTNNSDLKNTYGPITITIAGERIETGEVHIGCLLGDHTKTSIGLQLNTGTVTGIACNLFGAGFPQTYVPSFSWGGAEWLREHGLTKAIETAKIAMSRRNREFVPEIEAMFRTIFDRTASEREQFLKKPKT